MKLGLIAVTALALFAGCAAEEEQPSSSESEVITRGRPDVGVLEGGLCAGIGGFECAAGLECIIPEHLAGVADAAGKCEKRSNEGEPCGGLAGLACATGLQCVGTLPEGVPDAGGMCRRSR